MTFRFLLAVLVLLGAPRPVAAGGELVIYAMTEKGRVYVNSTLFELLPGDFNLNNVFNPNGPERWTDIAVVGADRYELRLDGRIAKNGAPFRELPFFVNDFSWSRMKVSGAAVFALRTDGLLALDNGTTIELERDIYEFYDIAIHGGRVYVLRGDGALFADNQADPVVNFNGKKNKLDTKEGKGSYGASIWQRVVYDPVRDVLVVVRGDGQLQQWAPGDSEATILDSMPFPNKSEKVRSGHRYIDMEIAPNGRRLVLRRDGKVYDVTMPANPETDKYVEIVDYPGKTKTSKKRQQFVDLALLDGQFMAIRWDGKLYMGISEDLVVEFDRRRYVRLATSTTAPDLTSFNNSTPVAAVYSTKAVEGEALAIALVVTDVDRAEADLIVVPDLSTLPPEVSYDPASRTVTWPSPGPTGKSSFEVSVDDGFGKSPEVFTYKIDVKSPNTGGKNTAPLVSTVSTIQVLVNRPYALPILAVDRDGDDLTVTVDPGKGAFALGATYDEASGEFRWTAAIDDVGNTSAKFEVSDGNKTTTLTIKIEVKNSLIFGDG
jgi:hypothetical protein